MFYSGLGARKWFCAEEEVCRERAGGGGTSGTRRSALLRRSEGGLFPIYFRVLGAARRISSCDFARKSFKGYPALDGRHGLAVFEAHPALRHQPQRFGIETVFGFEHRAESVSTVSPGSTGTRACATTGPESSSGVMKCTVAPDSPSRPPPAPARAPACRGISAAARDGC